MFEFTTIGAIFSEPSGRSHRHRVRLPAWPVRHHGCRPEDALYLRHGSHQLHGLLLGVYCGGIYGGSITAILIRTPGTPASAATVMDGYPLTLQGRAKEALDTATLSSCVGGIFSCVVLILLAKVIADFALKFGTPEYFAVGIFGLGMVTAVLLGALMLQGITPGSMLFVQRPNEVNSIYLLMIMANIFFCILGVTCVPLFVKILKVPSSALMTGVLALCCIGSYAVRGYVFDIQCALVLAIVGYLFSKTDYPIPPVLLGLLLGKTIESNFRRAMTQTEGDWTIFFTRPICCVLLIISIAAFCWPIFKAIMKYVKGRKVAEMSEFQ